MAKLTRRGLLAATGWVAGGATVLYIVRDRAIAVAPTIIFPDKESGAAWLQIRPDGSCRMFFSRQDMGQNANTGLAQIVAEELNIDVDDIEGVLPNTGEVPTSCSDCGQYVIDGIFTPNRYCRGHAARKYERTRCCQSE